MMGENTYTVITVNQLRHNPQINGKSDTYILIYPDDLNPIAILHNTVGDWVIEWLKTGGYMEEYFEENFPNPIEDVTDLPMADPEWRLLADNSIRDEIETNQEMSFSLAATGMNHLYINGEYMEVGWSPVSTDDFIETATERFETLGEEIRPHTKVDSDEYESLADY